MINRNFYDFIQEESYSAVINGLRVNIIPKKGYTKSFAMITTKYGSQNIEFSKGSGAMKEYPKGIAHFLEHKLFEEPDGNIFNKFAKLGASPNAYTNFQITTYYFTCTEGFDENLKLLIKFVYNPYFTKENVEKEKGIIEQEIKMYDDNPNFKVYFNFLENMYFNNPVRYDIAGTVESIAEINEQLLYECYNTFYVPENMVLNIVGDIDISETMDIIEKCVPTDRGQKDFVLKTYDEPANVKNKFVDKKMGLSIPNFILGFKDLPLEHYNEDAWLNRKIQMEILAKLLFTRSSQLYEDLYEQGLINESFSFEYSLEKEHAHLIIGGESKNPQMVQQQIFKYISENRDHLNDSENFNRIKKSMIGSYINRFNSIEGLGNFISDYNIRGISPFKYYEVLKSIKLQDVVSRMGFMSDIDKWVLSVVD